jgi:uncharacterized protein
VNRIRWAWWAVTALLVGTVGCQPEEEWAVDAPVAFDTVTVVIETEQDQIAMTVELAESQDQRAFGLMERDSLAWEQGMLFVYPDMQSGDSGFWMFRTRMPLDIAFLGEGWQIVAIEEMEPCLEANPRLCPIYSPGVPYVAALEVNRGFFGRHGVGVGDRVRRLGTGEAAGR